MRKENILFKDINGQMKQSKQSTWIVDKFSKFTALYNQWHEVINAN